jgi:catechol 2,3-dioxygenase-like lactoylglutathione lyase family enzyme
MTPGPPPAVSPRVLHASLAVDDIDRSLAFYERAFGASVVLQERGISDLIQRTTGLPELTCDLIQLRFADGGALLELIRFHNVPPGREDEAPVRAGHGHVCLGVTDFDAALSRALACEAESLGEVVTYPDGRSVYLREPGGSVVELEEVAP